MNDQLIHKLNALKASKLDVVIVTLVNVRGSAPQEVGAKLIAGTEGLLFGTVGGGKVENQVLAHAKSLLLSESKTDFKEWNLQTDIGMSCGGVCSFFFEKIKHKPDWSIAIFGAGHVAQEVVGILSRLDCIVFCVDPRLEWLEKLPSFPNLNKIHLQEMKEFIHKLPEQCFIACMTMGHAFDLPILEVALREKDFPFIGAIGSETKSRTLKSDLLNLGIEASKIEKIKCPIGLDFGNNTPVEIALSIVADLIKTRDQLKRS